MVTPVSKLSSAHERLLQRYLDEAEFRQFRRLPIWSRYIKGAMHMLLRLREMCLLEEPHTGEFKKVTADGKVCNRAIIDPILKSKTSVDYFLVEAYPIKLTDEERDKKGRLVKCRACYAVRRVTYNEIDITDPEQQ